MSADFSRAIQDVPVYRLPEKAYYHGMDSYVSRVVGRAPISPEEIISKRNDPEARFSQFQEGQLRLSYGGPWKYNEIIGFIRIGLARRRVRGEYWAVHAKRIVRTRKKIFAKKASCLAPEVYISESLESSEIYMSVLSYIESCRSQLPKFHIDSSQLEAIGPYVDWKALVLAHNHSLQARRP